MARKKKEQKNVKYYIPAGCKEIIDCIVDNTRLYKNKPIWKQKFYHLVEYIAFQTLNNDLDAEKGFVNIHLHTMAGVLGVDNSQMSSILKDSLKVGLLAKDGIFKQAVKIRQGRKTVYVEEGKSYGYKIKDFKELVELEVEDQRMIREKFIYNSRQSSVCYDKSLNEYHEILLSIKVQEADLEEVIKNILINKQKKKSQKEKYDKFIESKETEYNITYNKINNRECIVYPFGGVIVPAKTDVIIPSYDSFREGVMVPEQINGKNTPSYKGSLEGVSVPCYLSPFEVRSFKRKKEVKHATEEPVETTIARVRRAVYIINNSHMFPSRPDKESRVYCEVTNLNRELRKSIRLDGKKVIGIDIANSQPLIASILIRNYWLNKRGHLPEDVKQYQSDCEAGVFYNNFMKAVNLPNELRPQFKQDFFKKVFFSKVIEKNNMLKDMFVRKYPSCWEAICDQKGGLYCMEYNEFAKMLQRVEAGIMFDVVNMGLIRQGIKAFNIFDSIYVTDRKGLETAKESIIKTFNAAGVQPSLKIEYEEHLEENERNDALELQHEPLTGHPNEEPAEEGASIKDIDENADNEQTDKDIIWTYDYINSLTDEEIAEAYEMLKGPIPEHKRAYKILEIRYKLTGALELGRI